WLFNFGWMLARCDPHAAQSDQWRSVHPECDNGCSSCRSGGDDLGGVITPVKVGGPIVIGVGGKAELPVVSQDRWRPFDWPCSDYRWGRPGTNWRRLSRHLPSGE